MKLSICIPTYNRASLLKRAILSALSQTYDDKEIVICDNCSSDDTSMIVKMLSEEYPDQTLCYYKHSTNIGMVPNWRSCLDYATGDYFMILDDDNFLTDPDYLSKVSSLLESSPSCSLICSAYDLAEPESTKTVVMDLESFNTGLNVYSRYYGTVRSMFFVFMNRCLAKQLNIYSQSIISHDVQGFLLLMLYGDVGYIPDCCGIYDKTHGGSVDTNKYFLDYLLFQPRIKLEGEILNVPQEVIDEPLKRLVKIQFNGAMLIFLRNINYRELIMYSRQVILIHGNRFFVICLSKFALYLTEILRRKFSNLVKMKNA
jgi:glycosyltransferase involved in cell wall biosynthesis